MTRRNSPWKLFPTCGDPRHSHVQNHSTNRNSPMPLAPQLPDALGAFPLFLNDPRVLVLTLGCQTMLAAVSPFLHDGPRKIPENHGSSRSSATVFAFHVRGFITPSNYKPCCQPQTFATPTWDCEVTRSCGDEDPRFPDIDMT